MVLGGCWRCWQVVPGDGGLPPLGGGVGRELTATRTMRLMHQQIQVMLETHVVSRLYTPVACSLGPGFVFVSKTNTDI